MLTFSTLFPPAAENPVPSALSSITPGGTSPFALFPALSSPLPSKLPSHTKHATTPPSLPALSASRTTHCRQNTCPQALPATGREGFESALRQTGQRRRVSAGDEGSGSSVKRRGVRWCCEKTCGAVGEEAGQMGEAFGFLRVEREVSGVMVGVSEGVQKEGRLGFWDCRLLVLGILGLA